MAQHVPPPEYGDSTDQALLNEMDYAELHPFGPSLPVILFSAACGVGSGIIALYLTYRILLLDLPVSAGIATLVMLAILGGSAAGLSVVTRSSTVANVALGCGLVVVTMLFFAFCSFVGALTATLLLNTP